MLALRQAEADEFYASVIPASLDEDRAMVMRQALAGMLWTKQHYYFDLDVWLREHSAHPLRSPTRFDVRNQQWSHMVNDDVISMPDKWEYPWYAAWDLAFHAVPLAMVDPEFAREQLALMLSSTYLHPSGQIPAYEWNFGDVNPPVHAAALALVYGLGLAAPMGRSRSRTGRRAGELAFLAEAFNMLLVNFTWWVNRKDPSGKNLFQGGFLGLDNIGVFDRSAQLPGGGTLEQSDGTAWMAFFSQSMLELALALAEHDPAYEGFVVKFVQHWFQIAVRHGPARRQRGRDVGRGGRLLLRRAADARRHRPADQGAHRWSGCFRCAPPRSCRQQVLQRFPRVSEQLRDYFARNADLLGGTADPTVPGVDGRRLLALVDEHKLRRILERMLDEDRFLGPHGIRSVSKWHEDHPYTHRRRRSGLHRRVRTGRVAQRHVRRQLQLAWPGVVPDQPAARSGRCCSSTGTTATTSGSSARPAPATR